MSYSPANDNFAKIVNQGLFTLLNAEFPREKIVYQPEFRQQDLTRSKYFRIYANGSSILDQGTMYEQRSYSYQISFYYQYSGDKFKREYENTITNEWDHLYFMLMSNREYEPASGYAWHNVVFEEEPELVWGFDDDEEPMENVGHIDGIVQFWRTNQFEITEEIVIEGDIVLE